MCAWGEGPGTHDSNLLPGMEAQKKKADATLHATYSHAGKTGPTVVCRHAHESSPRGSCDDAYWVFGRADTLVLPALQTRPVPHPNSLQVSKLGTKQAPQRRMGPFMQLDRAMVVGGVKRRVR